MLYYFQVYSKLNQLYTIHVCIYTFVIFQIFSHIDYYKILSIVSYAYIQ